MSRNLNASDRKRLIKMASAMHKGSPERKAILAGLAKASSWEDDDDFFDANAYAFSLLRKKRIRDEGLNADWSVSAFPVSTARNGQTIWLVDNEDDSWSLVIRFYVDNDYKDDAGNPMPDKYSRDADGYNDAIVELVTFSPDTQREVEDMINKALRYRL